MNRERLYRGKRKDNGEWIEGYYVCVGGKYHYILTGKLNITAGYPQFVHYSVIPETVGKCTELPDKNGKQIFEGDIVVVNVKRHSTICKVSWAGAVAQFQLWQINTIPNTSTVLNLGNYDCEVIGNIHDTPELLEEGVNNG